MDDANEVIHFPVSAYGCSIGVLPSNPGPVSLVKLPQGNFLGSQPHLWTILPKPPTCLYQ